MAWRPVVAAAAGQALAAQLAKQTELKTPYVWLQIIWSSIENFLPGSQHTCIWTSAVGVAILDTVFAEVLTSTRQSTSTSRGSEICTCSQSSAASHNRDVICQPFEQRSGGKLAVNGAPCMQWPATVARNVPRPGQADLDEDPHASTSAYGPIHECNGAMEIKYHSPRSCG